MYFYSITATQALHEAELKKSNDKENLQTPAVSREPDVDGEIPDTLKTGGGTNTTTDNGIQGQQLTLNEILDEFAQQINLTFEEFCNDFELQCKRPEGQEGESVDNDESDAKSGDTNGDERGHCTLVQLESLKENVQSEISTLLQSKGNIYVGLYL